MMKLAIAARLAYAATAIKIPRPNQKPLRKAAISRKSKNWRESEVGGAAGVREGTGRLELGDWSPKMRIGAFIGSPWPEVYESTSLFEL